MPGRKSTDDQIAQRREDVARLYLQGWTQAELATRHNVHRSQISHDLRVIRREWLEGIRRNYDALVAEERAKLDNIEWEAWQGFSRSTEKERSRPGDPRLLTVILTCIDHRCKLLGLYAQDRHLAAPMTPEETASARRKYGLDGWRLPTTDRFRGN